MKKAQFEILGLAIVVIIISVAIFFLLSFSIQPEEEDTTAQFLEEQFAQNTLDALMKTTLAGCKGTVADYITGNVTGNYPDGPDDPPCSDERAMEQILSALDEAVAEYRGRQYRFQIRDESCDNPRGGGCEVVVDHGDCNLDEAVVGRPGRQLVSKYPDPKPAEVVLWICKPR